MKNIETMKFVNLGEKVTASIDRFGLLPLMQNALKGDQPVFHCYEEGPADKTEKFVFDKLNSLKGRMIYKAFTDNGSTSLWMWNDGMADVYIGHNSYLRVQCDSHDEKLVKELISFSKKCFVPPKKHGQVYAIVSNSGQLALSNLGSAGMSLIRENYNKNVMENYDFVIKDLNAESPSGRIVILEGEPGTGKTHIVKGMLMEVPEAMFILVAPDMVASLGGPQLLPLLLNYKRHAAGPIILILEDADKCLITRVGNAADTSVIQSILNLGDGILGGLLDIRIIATTNAKKFEMDGAILRHGRLSRRIEVGPLNTEESINIFKKLLPTVTAPKEFEKDKTFSLADVYFLARNAGWIPAPKKVEDDHEAPYDDDDDD